MTTAASHPVRVKRHPYNQWSPDARALDLVGDKWTLLIVRDLMSGPRRFVNLQRTLPGISTEQLRSRLNRMVDDELVTRTRYRELPPRVDYELTPGGRALAPVLGALADWGHQYAWEDPDGTEHVDVGAIIRLAPGLIDCHVDGTVALDVDEESGGTRYVIEIAAGAVTVHEGPLANAPDVAVDATVAGGEWAWIDALGPRYRFDDLEITVEPSIHCRELVELVLAGLAGTDPIALLRPRRTAA